MNIYEYLRNFSTSFYNKIKLRVFSILESVVI